MVSVRSLGLSGISGYEVTVECFLSGGLPAFDVVGLPDAAVRESRERVRAAVKTCGARFPVSRITVNLAPAGQRKEGTVYDLPILLGLLTASEELPPLPEDAAFRAHKAEADDVLILGNEFILHRQELLLPCYSFRLSKLALFYESIIYNLRHNIKHRKRETVTTYLRNRFSQYNNLKYSVSRRY